MPISKHWRAKCQVLDLLEGDYKGQYKRLGDYAVELRKTNPKTTTITKLDMLTFKRFCICLDACKKGFIACSRSLVGIDGCLLNSNMGVSYYLLWG